MFRRLQVRYYLRQLREVKYNPYRTDSLRNAIHERRLRAIHALGELKDTGAVDLLIEIVEKAVKWKIGLSEFGWEQAAAAAKALGRIGDQRAVQTLVDAVGCGRVEAADSLVALGATNAVEGLRKILLRNLYSGDGGAGVVARALVGLGGPKWLSVVNGNQNDLTQLAKTGAPAAIRLLLFEIPELYGVDVKNPGWVRALRHVNHPKVFELLRSVLKKLNPRSLSESGFDAIEVLACSDDKRCIEVLITALSFPDSRLNGVAAAALARQGQPQWTQWVKGENGDIQRLAAQDDEITLRVLLDAFRKAYSVDWCRSDPDFHHEWMVKRRYEIASALLLRAKRSGILTHPCWRLKNCNCDGVYEGRMAHIGKPITCPKCGDLIASVATVKDVLEGP